MKQDITFSIVTRAYNVEDYIEQCAKSVLEQSYRNWEWIVLDNGSTDQTGQILQRYAKSDSRIILYTNKTNYNKVEKSKDGLFRHYDLKKLSRGRYLIDLDSDDFLDAEFLQTIWNVVCDREVDIVAVGSVQFVNDNVGEVERIVCPKGFYGDDISEMGNDIWDFYDAFRPTWGKAFFKDFYFENVDYAFDRPWYVINGSDTYTNLRFLQRAHSCVCLDRPLYYYRIRNNSTQRSNYFPERYKAHDEIYYESEKLLQKWGKRTTTNLWRLWLIHFNGLRASIELLQNVDLEMEEYFHAIDRVLCDEVLLQYIGLLPDKYKIDMEQLIKSTLDRIGSHCEEAAIKKELLLFTRNYGRKYLAKKKIANDSAEQSDVLLYVISTLSEDNVLLYENELVLLGTQLITGVKCVSAKEAIELVQQYKAEREDELTEWDVLGRDLFAQGAYIDAAKCFAIVKEWNWKDTGADLFLERLVKQH